MSMIGPDLSGKRLGFLRDAMPRSQVDRVRRLDGDQNNKTFVAGIQAAADQAGIKLVVEAGRFAATSTARLMAALKQEACRRSSSSRSFMGHQDRIIAAARTARSCHRSEFSIFAVAGGS